MRNQSSMSFLDACYRNAKENPLKYLSNFFTINLTINWIYSLILIFQAWKTDFAHKVWTIHGVYFIGGFIVIVAKNIFHDTHCHVESNSMSGHAFFNMYYLIMWSYLLVQFGKKNVKLYITTSLTHIFNMGVTYFGGYHSLIQIFRGDCLAFGAVFVTLLLMETSFVRSSVIIIISIIVSGVGAYMTGIRIPSFIIYTLPALIWIIITLSCILYQQKEKKQKKE